MALRLGFARDMSVAEFKARSDAAWAVAAKEVLARINSGIGVPTARATYYARKNLVAAAFVKLEDRPHRGTMMGSSDGSDRRAFHIPMAKVTVEAESSDQFVLAAIPRALCRWVNQRFPAAQLAWPCFSELTGDFTDDQKAEWQRLMKTAELTNMAVDRLRLPPASRKPLLTRNDVA